MGFIVIAIDGTSGSGKSTIAKKLASNLNYQFISTGYYYRTVAYFILKNKLNLENEKEFDSFFKTLKLDFDFTGDIFINNKNITSYLFDEKISLLSSEIAKNPKLRKILTKMQQEIAQNKNVVMEGRDITTVVLPQASFKFFITCDVEKRAQRRLMQLEKKNIATNFNDILLNIKKRDHQDSTRKIAPLLKSSDAIEIDTTFFTINEILEKIKNYINLKE